jgi:hypothetical protein
MASKRLSGIQRAAIATTVVSLTELCPPVGAGAAIGWGGYELYMWWTSEDDPKEGDRTDDVSE